MSHNGPGQELLIQLETALHRLVESFWEEPYRYFTESDAVVALQSWIARRPGLTQAQHTADGFETGLLHREYPTFFRFDDSEPTQRLGPPAGRGHYDLVLINPAYVRHHNAETVHNRNIGDRGDLSTPPLLAAVEFKLFIRNWKPDEDPPRKTGLRQAAACSAGTGRCERCLPLRFLPRSDRGTSFPQGLSGGRGGFAGGLPGYPNCRGHLLAQAGTGRICVLQWPLDHYRDQMRHHHRPAMRRRCD